MAWCHKYGPSLCSSDGWLIWLRRVDNSVSFDRNRTEYVRGFADEDGNFWLGLANLFKITESDNIEKYYEMRYEISSDYTFVIIILLN